MTAYGTDPRLLAHAHGPDTEKVAAASVDTETWEERCHHIVQQHGAYGISPKRVKNMYFPGKDFSSISPRFTALKRQGLVFPTGEVEDGSEILVAKEYATIRYFLPEEVEEMLAELT